MKSRYVGLPLSAALAILCDGAVIDRLTFVCVLSSVTVFVIILQDVGIEHPIDGLCLARCIRNVAMSEEFLASPPEFVLESSLHFSFIRCY